MAEENAWAELQNRARIFGDRWPLRLSGNRLTRRAPANVDLYLYRFLCLCGVGSIEPADRRLFEVLSVDLLGAFTGCPSLHLGHPASTGMDPSFRKRIERYILDSGLLKTEIKAAPLSDDMDLGLDGASWKRFRDPRGGDLHFLIQCATGSDWTGKLHDLDLGVWSDHLNWGVTPIRVLSVPFFVSVSEAKWVRYCREAGVLLDRPRLLELASAKALAPGVARLLRTRVTALSVA